MVNASLPSNRRRAALTLANAAGGQARQCFASVDNVDLERLRRLVGRDDVALPQQNSRHLRVSVLHLYVLQFFHVSKAQPEIDWRFGASRGLSVSVGLLRRRRWRCRRVRSCTDTSVFAPLLTLRLWFVCVPTNKANDRARMTSEC
jgi:hypothetical protein